MAKNRKYQSAAIRFGPVLKVILLCSLFCGSGVGYVWQKSQIAELGQQKLKRELRLAELGRQNEKLKKQLAAMRSPLYLETRIKELNLGLVAARPAQVWSLKEPTAEGPKPPVVRQYVQQTQPQPLP